MLLGHRLHDDLAAIPQTAEAVRRAPSHRLPAKRFASRVDDRLPRNRDAHHRRKHRERAVFPCACTDLHRRSVIEDVGARPHLGDSLDLVRLEQGRCGSRAHHAQRQLMLLEGGARSRDKVIQRVELRAMLGDVRPNVARIECDAREFES